MQLAQLEEHLAFGDRLEGPVVLAHVQERQSKDRVWSTSSQLLADKPKGSREVGKVAHHVGVLLVPKLVAHL